jgi:hypothetical protein
MGGEHKPIPKPLAVAKITGKRGKKISPVILWPHHVHVFFSRKCFDNFIITVRGSTQYYIK